MQTSTKIKIWTLGIGIVVISGFLAYFWALKPKENTNSTESTTTQNLIVDNVLPEQSEVDSIQPSPSDPEPIELDEAGYIAYWDYQGGVSRYENSKDTFSEVLPTWYAVSEDGSITSKTSTSCDEAFVRQVQVNGDNILPTVSNASSDALSKILHSPTLTDSLIDSIIDETKKCGYDGIDLDFEKLHSTDKDKYSEFVCSLQEELHKNDKLLSITVLPKTDNPVYFVSESRQAQDWKALGACVDEFKIMTYDYTKSSDEAGPNSPNHWIKNVTEYALESVPKDKIQIGLPLYSYVWEEDREGTKIVKMKWEVETMFDDSDRKVISSELDQESGEMLLTYEKDGKTYVTYWNDSDALDRKKEIVKSYGIQTVFYWRL